MMWLLRFAVCLFGNTAKKPRREIYVGTLFRDGKNHRGNKPSRGLYIRRYGWLGSARRVGVGQDREVVE